MVQSKRTRAKSSRKAPLVTTSISTAGPSTSRSVAQARISEYHHALKRSNILHASDREKCASSLEHQDAQYAASYSTIQNKEALDAYQKLSQIGQDGRRGGDSSKVLVPWLEQYRSKSKRIRMLELGAVRHDNYLNQASWLHNTPIDLHSQHPAILEQDFFDRPPPTTHDGSFDIISCSLVLNFVSDAHQRGRMLSLAHQHLSPKPASLLFLVLPLPCISNSRYLTRTSLVEFMADIGFELLKERFKPSGKVGYWLWGWRKRRLFAPDKWRRKTLLNAGKKRNNFAILLNDTDTSHDIT